MADFLRTSFWSNTPGFEDLVEELLSEPGGLFQGPWLSLKLPFIKGSRRDFFPDVPLPFTPHRHQEHAFERLVEKKNTLVATGTGSGKTECFQIPILAHCAKNAGVPGIKAILIYPMNALATDQAERFAKLIHGNDKLRDRATAGLYVGQGPDDVVQRAMGERTVITDRDKMRECPPDILLTNYKMLDYLLIRPADQQLWRFNDPETLQFLVVDELHTFDGAQGTDLACLLRRVKDRLGIQPAHLCCVGTSATLGGDAGVAPLVDYAAAIFGESFAQDGVVTEHRQSPEAFTAEFETKQFSIIPPGAKDALDPASYDDHTAYIKAQHQLWFGFAPTVDGGPAWRIALGKHLAEHDFLRVLLSSLKGVRSNLDLVAQLARRWPEMGADADFGARALNSFVALISEARVWGNEEKTRTNPFLQVQIQLWQRELRRMVASVGKRPKLRFHDDLTAEQRRAHLPIIYCRDCGLMGWATVVAHDKPHVLRNDLRRFYSAFFSNDPSVRLLFPDRADTRGTAPDVDGARCRVACTSLTMTTDLQDESWDAIADEEVLDAIVVRNTVMDKGREKLTRHCPRCEARSTLSLVGFQAATLTSVFINQLFASSFNDDKKLLTFSDSVQDAAHRAGFFGARTWRFNLRIAIQRVLEEAGDEMSLAELPARFVSYWRDASRPDGMGEEAFVAAFIAPNMLWLEDFGSLKTNGTLPEGSSLARDVERRITWEIHTEYGLTSRVGRTLTKMGTSIAYTSPELVEGATAALLEPLRNEVGRLRELDHPRLRVFLAGLLHQLKERGGILSPEIPEKYLETGGKDTFVLTRRRHLPDFGWRSRLPAFLTDKPGTERFDAYSSGRAHQRSWYQRWYDTCFADVSALVGYDATIAYKLLLPGLVEAGILVEHAFDDARVWGLAPEAMRVSRHVSELRCARCHHLLSVASAQAEGWTGTPCLTASCPGTYGAAPERPESYFGRLYRTGDVQRIYAEEHTGLLARGAREEIEKQFKSTAPKPTFPNLLSCTPTLEMGIDIGDLSTAVLCSVPPAQANYLQRIGRAGRRDGNALLLTIANARPHDLYFFGNPAEMIAGQVDTPGVFLNASAVLERQLMAYGLDRWVAGGVVSADFPPQMAAATKALAPADSARFPHNLIQFIENHQTALLEAFEGLFDEGLQPQTRQHLQRFMRDEEKGGLDWRILDALTGYRKSRDALSAKADKLMREIRRLRDAEIKDKTTETTIDELRQEQKALRALVKQLDARPTLEFFAEEGLIPNYAFPEAAVRLHSVIYRPRQDPKDGERKYETWTYEYGRAASSAIVELAPDNSFYASGRQVTIDQVDLSMSEFEPWRFCDCCNHSAMVAGGDPLGPCPACGSEGWGDVGQRRDLIRLRRVFASTSDRKSRIDDAREERQPKFYNRQLLVVFQDSDREGAWRIADEGLPFAFELLRRVTFRELNFGVHGDEGARFSIAGREAIRKGFRLCRHCGMVQTNGKSGARGQAPANSNAKHSYTCPAKGKDNDNTLVDCVYLYREFSSEALRLLLPVAESGTERQQNSFVAAFGVGLRAVFGGKVDHLQTTMYSEPDAETGTRKQFLVIYDTVPGGTGYLKELVREPKRLFDVLRAALQKLKSCRCRTDPARDGCYACLFAYRNSNDMADTSRDTAVTLLSSILKGEDSLTAIPSLNNISISSLLDSVLEERFLEALRRAHTDERPCTLRPDIEFHKACYRFSIGGRKWVIEPQVEVGPKEGYPMRISIDFVLHPRRGQDRKPIAVFLDGLQYHRDRIGHDQHQRMALLTKGEYEVWSFTWDDVESQFRKLKDFSRHLQGRSELTDQFLHLYGVHHLRAALDEESFALFIRRLATPAEETATWRDLAFAVVASQLDPHADAASWIARMRAVTPPDVADAIEDSGHDFFGEVVPPENASSVKVLFATSRETVAGAQGRTSRFGELDVICWLDDAPETRALPEFVPTWGGMLRLMNILQFLPRAWFFAREMDVQRDYGWLIRARTSAIAAPDMLWQDDVFDLLLAPGDIALANKLRAASVPLPEVGIGLEDNRGEVTDAEATFAWPELGVAIIPKATLAGSRKKPASSWHLFDQGLVELDLEPVVQAIKAAMQGEA